MEKDYFAEFFNGGLSIPKDAQADNENSFALTEHEMAFINSIEAMESSFRSLMSSIAYDLEEKTKSKNLEFAIIKSDFLKAIAAKHKLTSTSNLEIDTINGLLVHKKND